ncbi:copper amine oxidase [Microbacterium karelineae]|uniref:copper amine oxidase n=1 Tax=Microbacterium karelineae TaxID=2654283 RepID=UPI0012EA49F2|nr:copper amine oxidase [Microbacterium karelineae]
MRTRRLLAALALGLPSVLLLGCVAGAVSEEPTADPETPAVECEEGEPLSQAFDNGSAWTMCWQVQEDVGLLLTDIGFAPTGDDTIPILESLAIAQLEVPYDDGERLTNDITEAGFGSGRMQTLTETECVGERIATAVPNVGDGTYGKSPVREVLCSEVVDDGLGYRSSDGALVADRRQSWQLGSISKVGWYEYVAQYAFGSDGTISPSLGATGDISPLDFTDEEHGWPVGEGDHDHAASHSHNAVWRAHWALGATGDLRAEQYDATETGEHGSESPILDGTLTEIAHPTTLEWENRRWWRVLSPSVENADGHPISYEIDIDGTDSFAFSEDQHDHGDEAGYDVAFTNADECQLFATHNGRECGAGVLDFVADSAEDPLRDIVSWVAVGFHHVVRDEDQSPMDTHWQGFTLLPRDLTAQRVGIPSGREDVNGIPEDSIWRQGEDDE